MQSELCALEPWWKKKLDIKISPQEKKKRITAVDYWLPYPSGSQTGWRWGDRHTSVVGCDSPGGTGGCPREPLERSYGEVISGFRPTPLAFTGPRMAHMVLEQTGSSFWKKTQRLSSVGHPEACGGQETAAQHNPEEPPKEPGKWFIFQNSSSLESSESKDGWEEGPTHAPTCAPSMGHDPQFGNSCLTLFVDSLEASDIVGDRILDEMALWVLLILLATIKRISRFRDRISLNTTC